MTYKIEVHKVQFFVSDFSVLLELVLLGLLMLRLF